MSSDLKFAIDPAGIKAYTGLIHFDQNSQTIVRYVLSDGPAYSAGILSGDEIVALNGRRYNAVEMTNHVEPQMQARRQHSAGNASPRSSAHDRVSSGRRTRGRWQLSRIVSDPTAAQKSAYSSWLQQPWPE